IKSMQKNPALEFCSIVNISSRAGFIGSPTLISYGASKWAVRGLTKSIAAYASINKYKIRANSVHPGLIKTDMTRGAGWFDGSDKLMKPRMERGILLRRSANPIEVANMVLFLASDEASFCNGSEFLVDGGVL
ncbi:3-alpha-(or 20-beta)-hydroxysteroid dehydrogenase, partial [Gonapodya sp. JEL0774]